MNYTILPYTASCYFFDANNSEFSSAGCTVGSCSSPLATQCLCTHLTSFSNAFYLPQSSKSNVNMNPFSSSGAAAFSLTSLNQNPVALAFCVGCICVYLICLIVALRFDIFDKKKVCYYEIFIKLRTVSRNRERIWEYVRRDLYLKNSLYSRYQTFSMTLQYCI